MAKKLLMLVAGDSVRTAVRAREARHPVRLV
jgi:hypothetical protein